MNKMETISHDYLMGLLMVAARARMYVNCPTLARRAQLINALHTITDSAEHSMENLIRAIEDQQKEGT